MPTPSESRVLLRTMTGEDFQPTRVCYTILTRRRLDAGSNGCAASAPTRRGSMGVVVGRRGWGVAAQH